MSPPIENPRIERQQLSRNHVNSGLSMSPKFIHKKQSGLPKILGYGSKARRFTFTNVASPAIPIIKQAMVNGRLCLMLF